MESKLKGRIESIDILRGIAMVIMALDHVRDYFHFSANTSDPLDLDTTTPLLFFTRWITHFCAPVFIFLSGTSIYLQSIRKSKSELSLFLLKRGLWLILVEMIVITFGWSFNPNYPAFFMQVIWAIGISMALMAFIIYLPYWAIFTLGVLIVIGHNFLDYYEIQDGFKPNFIWDISHHGVFKPYEFIKGHSFLIVYPFLPWTGVMMLGYCLGILYSSNYSQEQRLRNLKILGLTLIVLFIILRYTNLYGNKTPWEVQKNILYSLFSFIDVNKYPPSLLYICMTLGPSILVLAWLESFKITGFKYFKVFGSVALFYYILHIYLIHALCMLIFFVRGHHMSEAVNPAAHFPFYFVISGEGFSLPLVYFIWILVVLILYPICKIYDKYKTKHKNKKWLSYL
ncbi:MAG: heparan-alpha-glucosaminide N-acetyltransferase domain-containing protein [bacterium]|nr:heparan-alpha-glucosaminide N-acetyltransferase domain-containing protein [bacterium]